MSTVLGLRAMSGRMANSRCMAGDLLMMLSKVYRWLSCWRRAVMVDRSRKVSTPPMMLPSWSVSGAALMLIGTLSPRLLTMVIERLAAGVPL